MAWQDAVEQTVIGLGYDLVELERSAGGMLRVTIDLPWEPGKPGSAEQFVTVEDCEKVTRQLQFLLEVETVDYKRLEVGSPGIDRPLRNQRDFERFVGQAVDVTLKAPIGATDSGISANRKKFRGTLERVAEGGGWQLVWADEPVLKPGQKAGKNRPPPPVHALGFVLDDVRDARLAPIVSFKGRSGAAAVQDGGPDGA